MFSTRVPAASHGLAQRAREIPLPDALGGEFALGLTWSDDASRYAIQHYGSAIMRIRYLSIEPNRFLWRADRTTDGGKTWFLDAWMMEATRIGR